MEAQVRDRLIEAARKARANAYAPYSVYLVGAAALAEDGTIHTGCNVENVSFGLTVCAERSAIAQMVCSGRKRLSAIALATEDGGAPCGACLQIMREFAVDEKVSVLLVAESGAAEETTLGALAPRMFSTERLKRE